MLRKPRKPNGPRNLKAGGFTNGLWRLEEREAAIKAKADYPLVHYHGRNYTDHTVTLSVRGQRYEYFLTPTHCDTVEFLCRTVSARKALNFARSKATRVLKVRT